MQGWAVLENFSGQAWHDVTLTLLSGNPVTFRQALFESYYVERPSVPVEVAGRILPRPDTGGLEEAVASQTRGLPAGAPGASMTVTPRQGLWPFLAAINDAAGALDKLVGQHYV